jgi:hypothetical protein
MNEKSVIKHSAVISITNNINLLQRRVWNVLLSNAYDFLPVQETYEISLSKLQDILGIETRNTKYLKKSLKALLACIVEFDVLGKDGKNIWKASSLLAQVEFENGKCRYEYSSMLRKNLYNPAIYARISLSMQRRFRHKHTLALYELTVDYYIAKRKYGQTPFIDLNDFKKLMGFADSGKYCEFKDLKKYVIKPACKEINEKSDLIIDIEYQKNGRRITALRLHIKPNPVYTGKRIEEFLYPPKIIDAEVIEIIDNSKNNLADELFKNNIRPKSLCHKLASEYPVDYIKQHLQNLNEGLKNNKIKSEKSGAWLHKAITSKSPQEILETKKEQQKQAKKEKEQKKKEREQAAKEKAEREIKLNYDSYIQEQSENYVDGLPKSEIKRLEKLFLDHLKTEKKNYLFNRCRKKGVINCKNDFLPWIAEKYLEGKIMSFEDFKN